MNPIRRITLTGAALAVAFCSLPALADDASDAKGVVDKATATVNAFAMAACCARRSPSCEVPRG